MSASRSERSVDDCVTVIRNLVNSRRRQHQLLSEPARWHRLCSSMDAADDAGYAIDGHGNLPPSMAIEPGLLYLVHFGFVQALYLQQKAVEGICESLGYRDLAGQVRHAVKAIRATRNDVAHLTDRLGNRFLGIARYSLTPRSFKLYEFGSDREFENVTAAKLARDQREALVPILDMAISRLVDADEAHHARFRGESLAECLGPVDAAQKRLAAFAVKVQGVPQGPECVGDCLAVLERSFNSLAEKLERRGLFPNVLEGFDFHLARARSAIARLRSLFQAPPRRQIDVLSHLSLLARSSRSLVEAAEELDETYSGRARPRVTARSRREGGALTELMAKATYPLGEISEGVGALHGHGESFRVVLGESSISWLLKYLHSYEDGANRFPSSSLLRSAVTACLGLARASLERLEEYFETPSKFEIDGDALVALADTVLKELKDLAAVLEEGIGSEWPI